MLLARICGQFCVNRKLPTVQQYVTIGITECDRQLSVLNGECEACRAAWSRAGSLEGRATRACRLGKRLQRRHLRSYPVMVGRVWSVALWAKGDWLVVVRSLLPGIPKIWCRPPDDNALSLEPLPREHREYQSRCELVTEQQSPGGRR